MSKYIDKNKLITDIQGTISEVCLKSPYDAEWFTRLHNRQMEIVSIIENAPTADVQPVRRGKWIVGDDGTYCSNCGKKPIPDIDYDLFWQSNYCPNCGSYNREE